MKAYLNSFLITLVIYMMLGFGFFYTFVDDKKILKKEESKKIISLSHVELKKQKEPKKVIKKKPIIKPKKVIKTKKKVKKKIVKKEKKVNKKPIKKEPIKKIEKYQSKQVVVEKKKNSIIIEEKSYINKNLLKIRKAIQDSIKYPKRARLFEIQGIVFARFEILENGSIKNIVILKGHRLLSKATIKAIKKASKKFPKTKKHLTIELPIEYRLK